MQVPPSAAPRWSWLALLPALGCPACSGADGHHAVQGKVLYKNQPARGVLVTFHPAQGNAITAVRPVGTTGEDGSFMLATGARPGAAPGQYVVTLVWPEEVAPKGKLSIAAEMPQTRDRLRGAYANPAKSTLKVQVREGANRLDPFQLN